MKETGTVESAERTEKNIACANGILTISFAVEDEDMEELRRVSKGTQHGIDYATELGKTKEQLLFVSLPRSTSLQPDQRDVDEELERTLDWIISQKVTRCAIGGPRESESPGIQAAAFSFLVALFEKLKEEEQNLV